MTNAEKRPQARSRAVFNAAADHFDDISFWELVGRRTVELTGIGSGQRVLDVCCGSGASALPAAALVGSDGYVLGVDMAERLLDLGRSKAKARGLEHLQFRVGDMLSLPARDASFDAVLCVLGIFFVPDIVAALHELWRVVKPGGTLAITSWRGDSVLEPASGIFWDAVQQERPDLFEPTPPWDPIKDPSRLAALVRKAGLPEPAVTEETFDYPVDPDRFWTLVLGSGYRGVLDRMDPESVGRVRDAVYEEMARQDVRLLTWGVLYARLSKPAG